jgi:cellulose biosynthesis protein BcsQ
MLKNNSSRNNNAVFINSFKGGTGKTSISLSLCVSAALSNKNRKQYNNIFYFDIDLLGTGSCYKLFPEGTEGINFFDEYSKKIWYKFSKKINLGTDGEEGMFYALCINPKLRIKKANYENTVIKVNTAKEQLFISSVIDFIEESSKEKLDNPNLYIFDCSPGFNNIERLLISQIDKKTDFDVKEVFVTSYDSSHVEKTVECLKEYFSKKDNLEIPKETLKVSQKSLKLPIKTLRTPIKKTKIVFNDKANKYIALNDIHDLKHIETEDGEKINLDFYSAIKKIQQLFNTGEKNLDYNNLYNIFDINYNKSLCTSNLLTLKVGLERSYNEYNISNSELYKKVVDYVSTEK